MVVFQNARDHGASRIPCRVPVCMYSNAMKDSIILNGVWCVIAAILNILIDRGQRFRSSTH